MPPTVPPNEEALLARIAGAMNQVGAIGTQQQLDITTPTGKLVLRTGILPKFAPVLTPTNYTSGYGLEVLSQGAGSPPTLRMGLINWQSPSGGAQTILGLVFMDGNGTLRVIWSNLGAVAYDTSGNALGNVPYFTAGGSFVGIINF